jgi:glycosyltransferase involved in cell wall biosynthesis
MDGINVIGYVSAPFGLGVAARNTVRIIAEKGIPVAVADLPLDKERSNRDHTFDNVTVKNGQPLPYHVNIFHCNPPVHGALIDKKIYSPACGHCLNAAVPFWELPVLPEFWRQELAAMDLVLCPSRFIEQTVAVSLSGPRPLVRHYPQTAFLPERRAPGRARFGLPEKGMLFVLSFEPASDCDRKNPWAAIEAFCAAFAKYEDAYLVIKLNTNHRSAAVEQSLSRLREAAGTDRRIIIRDEIFPYDEVIAFYESCDAYVSLHRSEGLGLGPMEAMLLGKPVIATAWSGVMDFMDEANSCLVGYRLVPVTSPVYRQLLGGVQAVWADPDVAQAAAWMRRLYADEGVRNTIGKNAQTSMLARQLACRRGDVFETVRNIYERKKTFSGPEQDGANRDWGRFVSLVTELVEGNRLAAAIALYDSERGAFGATPHLAEFDGLMRRLREKAREAHR